MNLKAEFALAIADSFVHCNNIRGGRRKVEQPFKNLWNWLEDKRFRFAKYEQECVGVRHPIIRTYIDY